MSHRNKSANSYPAIQVHVTRGNLCESVHFVDALVLDSKGAVVAGFGNYDQVKTYPRSVIKMIQALYLVESEAYSSYGLTQAHLSLASASHNGQKEHTELVLAWLAKIEMQEKDLVCGPHMPYDEKTAHELIRQNQAPCRRHNNCSGKHAGILSALKKSKINPENYGAYDHPLQIRFREIIAETSGESVDQSEWGMDGCGIPTYAMSLQAMTRAFSSLNLDRPTSEDRKNALKSIREAVLAEPFYLGGTNDFCSDMIQTGKGRFLIKAGAEGVYGGALFDQGLSFSLKVRDGNGRASRVAAAQLLLEFKGLTESEFVQLSRHTQPLIKNCGNETVGKIFVPSPLIS